MKTIIIFVILILLSGCSFKTPKNEWQYKSASAFNSYKKNLLSGNKLLAKNDLSRAIKHSKKSANLTQLAKIYLGVSALNIAIGIDDKCLKYKNISQLLNNKELESYYALMTHSIKKEKVEFLPEDYKEFANHLIKKDFKNLDKTILSMKSTTSMMVSSALTKDKISQKTKDEIVRIASFNGYKKVVLFWLNENLKNTNDKNINKKITILEAK